MIKRKAERKPIQTIHASRAPLRSTDCPSSANLCTRKHWDHILAVAPEGLCQADAITVMNAARLLAELEDAESSIAAQGRDCDSTGRAMQAPWSTRHQACLGTWLKYSKALKLDPTARASDEKPPEEVRDGVLDILADIERPRSEKRPSFRTR
jgi:hypothetical protein